MGGVTGRGYGMSKQGSRKARRTQVNTVTQLRGLPESRQNQGRKTGGCRKEVMMYVASNRKPLRFSSD